MKGFFSKKQIESKSRPNGKTFSCASCGAYKNAKTPKMEVSGDFRLGILNIGQAPNKDEDRKGKHWQGYIGRTLKKIYRKYGIDIDKDCLNINAVNCRVTKGNKDRTPNEYEIACCRKQVLQVIEDYSPRLIILLGKSAVESVIGSIWKKNLGGIEKWRGFTIPDRTYNAWICPVFHPNYIEHNDTNVEEVIWEQDIKNALSKIEEPLPNFPDEEKQIIILEDKLEINEMLQGLQSGSFKPDPDILAFDIETTGLKPYAEGHKIVCTSFCDNPNRAYVIPGPKRKKHIRLVKEILEQKNIKKVAANMKFEDTWMNIIHDIKPYPWGFDTMQAAHILDNRPGICGLKFQVYINFGVSDYDSEVSQYLEGVDEKDGNSFNRILEAMQDKDLRRKILIYCGMDSLFEYKLAILQAEQIGIKL